MTKIMIDRDLLERIGELMHIIAHRQDDYGVEAEYLGSLLKKAIANPAQQGEAVEVVAWQDAENPLYTTAERRVMQEWANNQYPIVELMTVAHHQRILAASVPAGCKVVPVELLERLEHVTRTLVPHLQCHVELRALLASVEGGE